MPGMNLLTKKSYLLLSKEGTFDFKSPVLTFQKTLIFTLIRSFSNSRDLNEDFVQHIYENK
ncbi:hypothetical protein HMPREF1536_04299 [Parabacteroides gordonii MS-1 = DSM 23371]|uniref:Uncharacterized protein n=1 Tax=Parabacteroides gordonii MS-1 = DSM 23371 TaxID=1203610 RepID=A0A0F5IVE3_9BACT|nr:hypothetical protein HMPREF1536_04299 [Parabacteroides gordonii MS-1 = DSM 23371]